MTCLDQRDWMLADDGECLPQISSPAVIDALVCPRCYRALGPEHQARAFGHRQP